MTIVDLTLSLPRGKPYAPRPLEGVDTLAVHHSAGPKEQTPEQIADFHVRVRGWSGIGYNYLVYDGGEVYKVRPVGVYPACVMGHNARVICACLVGDFTAAPPSDAAVRSLLELAGLLRAAYPRLAALRGHREMPNQATACPGAAFDLDALRLRAGWPAS